MLNIVEKDKIIRLHLQGYSQVKINEITGVTRPTIRKYIREYESYVKQIEEAQTEEEKELLIIKSNAKPKYDTSNRKRFKVTTEVIEKVKELLEQNDELIKRNQRKLLMKKNDIHRIVKRNGYDISYRTICNLISELKPKPKEAFIRQAVDPGEIAEFDWGDVTLNIEELGGERRFKIGVFALKHSDELWANLYMHENTECFLDAHASFIEDIGGVTQEIVYDNARVQVKQFVGHEKHPSDALITLSNYYGYKYRFTNIYSGNEKGNVERGVELVRRRAYCEIQCFKTYADAVAALKMAVIELNQEIKQLTGKSADAVFAEEKKFLQPARIRLDVGVIKTCKVNKYSFIYVDANFYSVPDYLVGKEITVKKYPMYIKVYYNDLELVTFDRICGRNEYKVDITHYIRTLKKKPGAIRNSLALKQSATWLQGIFHNYFNTKPKEFVVLLELIKDYQFETVKRVVEKLEALNIDINIVSLESELRNKQSYNEEMIELDGNELNKYCMNQLLEIERLHQRESNREEISC